MPLQGPIPNIISLPYGKCPPLHIQAPSWKQLLKLLARLGDTRIEPTVEAVAVTKQQLQLRTVVQFVKVNWSDVKHVMVCSLLGRRFIMHQTNGEQSFTSPLTIQSHQVSRMRSNIPMVMSTCYLGRTLFLSCPRCSETGQTRQCPNTTQSQ